MKLKFLLRMFLHYVLQPLKILWAVIAWAVLPRGWLKRYNEHPHRAFRRRGIRLYTHRPQYDYKDWTYGGEGMPRVYRPSRVHCVVFGAGAGYRNGATLYIGRNCYRAGDTYQHKGRMRWAFGLTNNANAIPSTVY